MYEYNENILNQYQQKGNYVNQADLSSFYNDFVSPNLPNMSEYAKKTELPNLSGYVSDSQMSTYLSGYAKTTDIPTLTGYALKSEIPNLSDYALKGEIPNMDRENQSRIPLKCLVNSGE